MNIKYFDNFEGLWKDVTGSTGQVLQYGVSGWTNANITGGTSSQATWGSISGNITDQKDLTDYVQTYAVAKNSAISGATKTKITYDSKGLVTAGADIIGSDISGYINANKISSGLITNAEYDYLDGVSGNIQTQLNTIQTSANGRGYTLSVFSIATNLAANITYYFGNMGRALLSTAAIWKVYIPKDGVIKKAYIMSYASTTAGSNENLSLYIRKNNTTDTLIATIGQAAASREFSNSALSISVSAGDYIEMKLVAPNPYTTPPAAITFGGTIYIE